MANIICGDDFSGCGSSVEETKYDHKIKRCKNCAPHLFYNENGKKKDYSINNPATKQSDIEPPPLKSDAKADNKTSTGEEKEIKKPTLSWRKKAGVSVACAIVVVILMFPGGILDGIQLGNLILGILRGQSTPSNENNAQNNEQLEVSVGIEQPLMISDAPPEIIPPAEKIPVKTPPVPIDRNTEELRMVGTPTPPKRPSMEIFPQPDIYLPMIHKPDVAPLTDPFCSERKKQFDPSYTPVTDIATLIINQENAESQVPEVEMPFPPLPSGPQILISVEGVLPSSPLPSGPQILIFVEGVMPSSPLTGY